MSVCIYVRVYVFVCMYVYMYVCIYVDLCIFWLCVTTMFRFENFYTTDAHTWHDA